MVYVQLGFIQKCIDWIVDNIISPVFGFLSDIVGGIFKSVFEKVLQPLFVKLWGFQWELIKSIAIRIISEFLYKLEVTVLSILNAAEHGFRIFAGLEPVYDREDKPIGSLLLALAKSEYIIRALLILTIVSIVLCFLFALLGTVKSLGDLEGRLPIGKVMRATAKSLLILILIPVTSLFFITLGDALLKQMDISTRPGSGGMADAIFVMSTLDAVKEDYPDAKLYNSSTRAVALKGAVEGSASDFGLNDKYRKPFYDNGKVAWSDSERVRSIFDITRIDYMVGIGGGVLFIYLIGTAGLAIVARIFDILTLLLVQPFFAATMPLDDGERHKKWMDMFLAKLVSGYGLLVGMNVYLGIAAIIISGKVRFFGEGTTEAVDYLVRLLFLGVGAYAVIQAGPMVTTIMNVQAGRQEAMTLAYSSGIMATPAGALAGMVGNGISNILGRAWNRITGEGNVKGQAAAEQLGAQNIQDVPNAFGQSWNRANAYNGQDNAFNGTRPEVKPLTPDGYGAYTPPAGMFGVPSASGYDYSADAHGKGNGAADTGNIKQSMEELIGTGAGLEEGHNDEFTVGTNQSMADMIGAEGKIAEAEDIEFFKDIKDDSIIEVKPLL